MDWLSALATLLAAAAVVMVIVQSGSRPRSSVPGPWSLPLIGDTLALIKNPAKYMVRRHLQYGPVFRANLIGIPNLHVICDPQVSRSLLRADTEDAKVFAPGAAFAKLFGSLQAFMGYLNIKDQHQYCRKCMSSALSLQTLLPALDAVVRRHVESWAQQGDIQLAAACKSLALDLGVGVLSGLNVKEDQLPKVTQLSREFVAGAFDPLGWDVPGTAIHKALRARDKLQALLWDGFAERAKEIAVKYQTMQEDDTEPVQDLNRVAGSRINLLEAQLKGAAPWYTVDARLAVDRGLGNVMAASETTRHMFLIVLCCVALSERVKAKLQEEQRQVIASHGPELSVSLLNAMTYLDATVKEAMRLLPASILVFRQLVHPLKMGQHTLPAGTLCTICTQMLHATDPALLQGAPLTAGATGLPPHIDYETNFASAFQPERWLDDDTKPKSYATFSVGTHLCIGMQVAYTEAKLLLVHLIRGYEFELVDKDVLKKMAAMFPGPSPAHGTDHLRISRRPLA